jgi:hypothetical protein
MVHPDTAAPAHANVAARDMSNPAFQAYRMLHVGFTVAPLVAGIDKFTNVLANWTDYLWPAVPEITRIPAGTFMLGVGVVEIIAGILVAVKPRIGGYVVGAWLIGIIINLLLLGTSYDVALRDVGLAIGAFALARLATVFTR